VVPLSMAYPFCGSWPRLECGDPNRIRHFPYSRQSTTFDYASDDYDRLDNPYVSAARCLWQIYQETEDIVSACKVMQWTVQRYGWSMGRLWHSYGYVTEGLDLGQLCPLDE
jgi:hypothetical protein